MRHAFRKLVLFIIRLSLITLLFEGVVRYLAFSPADREVGAASLFKAYHDDYQPWFGRWAGHCGFYETLVESPALNYVHRPFEECTTAANTNRDGFLGTREIPLNRDASHFTIMISGGSVAEQFTAGPIGTKESWLQAELNRRFISPSGKPFLLLNGAVAGWNLPTPLHALINYGSRVDAFLIMDGFNEAIRVESGWRIDTPNLPIAFWFIKPDHAFLRASFYAGFHVRKFLTESDLFKNSFLAYFLYDRTAALQWKLQQEWLDETSLASYRFPSTWTESDKTTWNMKRYLETETTAFQSANGSRILFAHVLQPIPLIGKTLTADETSYRQSVSAKTYELFRQQSASMSEKGVPTIDLTDVFRAERSTIYGDMIHCRYEETGDSPGYRLMAKKIASELGVLWKLKARLSEAPNTEN